MRKVLIAFLWAVSLGGCATLPAGSEVAPARAEAERAYRSGDYATAARLYEGLAERDAAGAEDYYRLGNALVELGRPEEAVAAYNEALERDPGLAEARHNLGLLHLRLGLEHLLGARRELPEVDAVAEATTRYLVCVMETLMGVPRPESCEGFEGEDRR